MTQWNSESTVTGDRDVNSFQERDTSSSTSPKMSNRQVSRSMLGVLPNVMTGHLVVTNWPGGAETPG